LLLIEEAGHIVELVGILSFEEAEFLFNKEDLADVVEGAILQLTIVIVRVLIILRP